MELVALLSTGKGTWSQVAGLLNYGDWEKVILIGNEFSKKFSTDKEHEFIEMKETRLMDIKEELQKKLKGKIKGTEVALSIASGEGKEHMALISALLSLPVGVRFTALTKQGVIML